MREEKMAAPAAVAGPVAYRVLRKRHDGEWVTDGRAWCDGVPTQDLVDDIALRSDGWRIEYAFAAPTTQPAPVAQGDAEDAARWRFVTDLDNQEFAVCQWSEIECEWLLVAHPGDIDIAMAKEGGAA